MKRLILLSLLLLGVNGLMAIIPPLEREVNITFTNERFTDALTKIQEQTGLVFSYKPSIINGIGNISLQIRHKTVREALSLMLPKSIIYKSKNNYIILKEKPEEKNPKKTEISGYVYDKATEQKVANVTIYDKESLQSVTTDEYGYYSISVPASNEKININKENYKDTVLSVSNLKENNLNNITLAPVSDSLRKQDSVIWKDRLKEIGLYTNQVFKKFRGFVNTINVRDTIERNFQLSLFPFVGTNHKLSGNVVNRLSFNIIGGFAEGVHGTEIGGLFNIDRENTRGAQIAGLFNIVGDSAKGAQIATGFNITGGAVQGFQGAGLMNLNNGTQKGFQVAAMMNLNSKGSKGVSVAGLMNIAGDVKGIQIACLGNINDTLTGFAISGMFNVTDYGKRSAQIAYGFNKQSSGTTWLQIAGFFNSAKYLKGIQIAPFNFSDTASGVPIGFFSFVKKGVHQLDLSADELFAANISFRTGVPAFYNIFSIGFASPSTGDLTQLGYGVGTSFRIKNRLRSDVTLSMHHISKNGFYYGTNELYKLYLGVEYKVGKKFSIAAGPTFNLFMSDALLPDYHVYQNIMPYQLFNTTNKDDFNLKGWIGGKIALRFF